jgi:hypothetical protein
MRDRNRISGFMDSQHNEDSFDLYRGNFDKGIALSHTEEGDISAKQIVMTYVLNGATCFDFVLLHQQPEMRLVVYSYHDDSIEEVKAVIISHSESPVRFSEIGTGTLANKLRVKSILGKYLVAGLDESTGSLRIYEVDIDKVDLPFRLITSFMGVKDFDLVEGSNNETLNIYYIKNEDD